MAAETVPGYWMNETSGALRPAMEAYLYGEPMQPIQVATERDDIARWLARAESCGIDPL